MVDDLLLLFLCAFLLNILAQSTLPPSITIPSCKGMIKQSTLPKVGWDICNSPKVQVDLGILHIHKLSSKVVLKLVLKA